MQADATPEGPSLRRDAVTMRRTKARVILLNDRGEIAFAERAALELLARMLQVPMEELGRFPLPIERAINDAARSLELGFDITIEPVPNLLVRVIKLAGRSGDCVIALHVEHRTQRQALTSAARSYKLTKRETDVLALILQGKNTALIARELVISEATATDYSKRLLQKTFSKSRAEMLAKILDWQPEESSLHPRFAAHV
jgi:DNA-binding NarL/FixJ family response regulator